MQDRKYGENTERGAQGRFVSGNPGKPKGARHKTTIAIESLLEGEAEALTRKLIEIALNGDTSALKLCLERLAPPRKEAPISIELPKLKSAADIPKVLSKLMKSVSLGEISPGEAERICHLLETFGKTKEIVEFEIRLNVLEKQIQEVKK